MTEVRVSGENSMSDGVRGGLGRLRSCGGGGLAGGGGQSGSGAPPVGQGWIPGGWRERQGRWRDVISAAVEEDGGGAAR